MPLNPPPIISAGLCLITQPLAHASISRSALVTFACGSTIATLADAQDAIDDFRDNFIAHIGGVIDDDVLIDTASIKVGQGTTTPLEAVQAAAPQFGTNVEDTVPPNTAVLVKKTTGLGGKANRGRTYFPWVVSRTSCDEAGHLAAGFISAFQTDVTAFLAQLAADNTPMCIANRVFNVPLAPHFVTHINTGPLVTNYNVEAVAATQRRRLRS